MIIPVEFSGKMETEVFYIGLRGNRMSINIDRNIIRDCMLIGEKH